MKPAGAAIANIASLAAIQGFNAITPLLIFPKILIVLGPSKFSTLVVAESFSFLVLATVLFSFEISGVRDITIALQAKDTKAIAEKFINIFFARMFIYFGCLIAIVAAYFITGYGELKVLGCWSMLSLGLALQSGYYFQALERNITVAIATAISRIMLLLFVFWRVESSWPSYYPAFLIGLSYLLSGAICFYIAILELSADISRPSIRKMLNLISDGRHIFSGNVYQVVTRDATVFYLGVMGFSPGVISSYSLAEKVLKSFQAIIRPLNQHYFARAMRGLRSGDTPNCRTLGILMRNTYPQILVLLFSVIVLGTTWAFFAKQIMQRFSLPAEFDSAMWLLSFMIPAAIVGVFNFMTGSAGLNNLGESRAMARALGFTGTFYIFGLFSFSQLLGIKGAAINITLSELTLAGIILFIFLRSGHRGKTGVSDIGDRI